MSLTFHRTFSLSRSSIAKIIQLVQEQHELNRQSLALNTDLGTVYQEAMPRYAYRAGLLDQAGRLTPFGRYAARCDPGLEKLSTQWLLHYHLSAPHGPTAFWHYLVHKRFRPGNAFTDDDLVSDLTEFLRQEAGKLPKPRSIRSTVTIFIGTYLKMDGLGSLRLVESTANGYYVPLTEDPPLWVIGYALAEYWQAHYGERLTINLDDLTQGDFAGVFLLGEERLNQLLLQLKKEGMIDLYRISRPYQVVLLQPGLEYALAKIYQT